MQRKKLITLIALVAILLCGACFLPPPQRPAPRPASAPQRPRSQLDLRGSKWLHVIVSNTSGTHHVDTGILEGCITDSINGRKGPGFPPVTAGGEPSAGDSVLSVAIEKEIAKPEEQQFSDDSVTWDFDVTLSAFVTRPDGTVVWSGPSRVYQGVVITAKDGDAWTSAAFVPRAHSYICDPLAKQMLAGGG